MNGASALDCEKTISNPNKMNITTIGASQYFFSCRRNCQNSLRTRILLMRASVHSQVVFVVAVSLWIGSPARILILSARQRVLPDESPDHAEWQQGDRKQHGQQHARVDVAQRSRKPPPHCARPFQERRMQKATHEQHNTDAACQLGAEGPSTPEQYSGN